MIKKIFKYTVATFILATTIQATPAFADPITNGQIEATKEQINDFETKIQQLDNRIILAMEKTQELNEQIVNQQSKIEETKAEIVKAETDLENHKMVYSERLKSIQLNGDQSVVEYAELLLSSGSVSEFFNRFTAISQIIESDTELLNGLNEKEQSLKDAVAQLNSQMDQLKQDQEALATEQKQIEEDKKQIENDLASAEGKLRNQLAQQEAEQQAQLAEQAVQEPQQQSSVNTTATATATATPPVAAANETSSATASAVIANAKQYLGVPYVWGGSTPSGFDCSGFTSYVYRSVGISLPRTSRDQQNVGKRISVNEVQPGDLVFMGSPAYHVGIYIGGGQYIHAPQTGDVVKIASYKPSNFSSASRVLQ